MFTQGMEDSQMTTVSCVLIALSCLVAVFVLSMTQLHLKIVSKGQTLKMSEKQVGGGPSAHMCVCVYVYVVLYKYIYSYTRIVRIGDDRFPQAGLGRAPE
jgi:hypothetical protein